MSQSEIVVRWACQILSAIFSDIDYNLRPFLDGSYL